MKLDKQQIVIDLKEREKKNESQWYSVQQLKQAHGNSIEKQQQQQQQLIHIYSSKETRALLPLIINFEAYDE